MILTDHEIEYQATHYQLITPFNPEQVQPASYDMTLDGTFRFYKRYRRPLWGIDKEVGDEEIIDVKSPRRMTVSVAVEHEFVIGPHNFVLASTLEKVKIPNNMVGRIEGKSSLARMGLFVHVTAGFCDPGFEGYPTLELFNANHLPIKVYFGMPICQMAFERLSAHAKRPYGSGATGSKYADQPRGPVESMYFRNFEAADG